MLLAQVTRRITPQPAFPLAGNADGAHHYRESGMAALLQFAVDAGWSPTAFYCSDRWDDEPFELPDQRSNLVVAMRRAPPPGGA